MSQLSELADLVGGVVALAAVVAFLIVAGLYLSQRRDLARLREWMERDPGHPRRDLVASESMLDRSEAELEQLEAERSPELSPPPSPTPGDRPTLSKLTLEREALKPHPRWRRFVRRATQPKVLAALGALAILLGVIGVLASERLLEFGSGDGSGGPPEAAEIRVAVINATDVTGASQPLSDEVADAGFDVERVDAVEGVDAPRTQVLWIGEAQTEAKRVARALKIDVERVGPARGETRRAARNTDVAVVVGDDRAEP